MFNTAQTDVLNALIPTMRDKGFDYYLAYTSTSTSSGWGTTAKPDLYVVFSSEEIAAATGYDYTIPSGSVLYTIRSVNYSTSDTGVNTDRIVTSDIEGPLTVPMYEHIYSNADYSASLVIQPDFNFRGAGETYEKIDALGIVGVISLLFAVFVSFFKR